MITYKALRADRRQFLALTGLTLSEFQRLLTAFPQAYQQLYPATQTAEGQPRQRAVGGGVLLIRLGKGRQQPWELRERQTRESQKLPAVGLKCLVCDHAFIVFLIPNNV